MPVVSKTHVGMVRKNNEDSILVREPHLFAIADGMGGYAAGEVASREALDCLESESRKFEGLFGGELIGTLQTTISTINKRVYELAASNAEYEGMGTTLTGVYLPGKGQAYVFNVGDSRLYLLRKGHLEQITKDHSLVADMVARGEITEKEAANHPQKNMLLKGIGIEERVRGDVFVLQVYSDDTLFLCSDGLSDMLSDSEIEKIMKAEDLASKSNALMEQALLNGGRDNISFIIISLNDSKEVAEGGR